MSQKPTVAAVRERLMKKARGAAPSVGYPELRRFSTGSLMLDRDETTGNRTAPARQANPFLPGRVLR